MPTITTPNTNIEIFYEDHGDPAHEVILLVMGLGAQLTLWPDELVEALVSEGFRVIRYDNRDIGLSQKFDGARALAAGPAAAQEDRLACPRALHPHRHGA
jgi:alpha-beta hydrolase superfamily lysophospholipase